MKRWILHIVFSLLALGSLNAQNEPSLVLGEVTFVTSNSVYVRFTSTEQIQIGDTLYVNDPDGFMIPCLFITNKSSTSSVCDRIEGCLVAKGDEVFYRLPQKQKTLQKANDLSLKEVRDSITNESSDPLIVSSATDSLAEIRKGRFTEKIRGRISAASYSNFSDTYLDRHRLMTRFSLRAEHIRNSPVSIEAYLNYRNNIDVPAEGASSSEGFFRVYNLAVSYDVDSSFGVTIGRKINYKASSLGAIDGLQAEKYFGSYFVGAIAGFRPDIRTFELNTQLFQYGLYGGFEIRKPKLNMTNTFGLLEQQNAGAVDRRYVYFQHNSSIGRSLYFFGSFEFDLYSKMIGQQAEFNPRLTNLFISARYRFTRWMDLTLSYDSRRRIIFFESLKTDVERLLDDDEARQGIRTRLNIRPIKYMSMGVSYSKRFQSDMQNPSDNINGYISQYRMPWIGGRLAFNFNWNLSSFLNSQIYSVRYNRPIIKKLMDAELYYRNVNYAYVGSKLALKQDFYGTSINLNLGSHWSLSVLYEYSARLNDNNQRMNSRIIYRFR